MFYEEKIIKGVLCHRSQPDGEWKEFSKEDLTGMLNNWRRYKQAIMDELQESKNDNSVLIANIYTLP